jgi:hypothetical protein
MSKSLEILKLDSYVLSEKDGWAESVKRWIKDPSAKMPTTKISSINYLLYVRAMSRVLIDFMSVEWNETKDAESKVLLLAEGSVHLTSDYDVSLAGVGSARLAHQIEQTFLKQTGYNLSQYADTNLYVLPLLSLTCRRVELIGPGSLLCLSTPPPDKSTPVVSLYIPYPTQSNGGEEVSRNSAICRLRKAQESTHLGTFHQDPSKDVVLQTPESTNLLFALALRFEEIVYTSEQVNWVELWDLLSRIQLMTPDAYHSMGAFCVVVVEMQRWKEKRHFDCSSLYLDSAMENIACLLEHHFYLDGPLPEYLILLQTIKYVYRAVYSLQQITNQKPETRVLHGKTLDWCVPLVRSANQSRGSTGFQTSTVYEEYVGALPAIRELLRGVLPE